MIQNAHAVLSEDHSSDHKLLFGKLVFEAATGNQSQFLNCPYISSPASLMEKEDDLFLRRTVLKSGLNYANLTTLAIWC